ncbi:MAG: hypothetical protein ACJAT5_000122 [Lentimonas sp.]|jgi:hypothetical protein
MLKAIVNATVNKEHVRTFTENSFLAKDVNSTDKIKNWIASEDPENYHLK